MRRSRRAFGSADRFGFLASFLCAIHCALLPLLIAALPSLGVAVWLGEGFEEGFVAFATLFGLFTLVWGYRRHHRVRALWLLLPGLLALWLGVLYAPLHHALLAHAVVMTVGGTLVGLAHLANLRLHHCHVHGAGCAH
ncbi:MerC domain-containing protein [Cognatiluteimonas weifangensis]|uniref:MerC domain-containing protein n=1 Tax=Cognatiluteimonas weifangensis TaxID=2303539 RepID=A0A372DJE3_9GAMM|nr:MerC domain-containing protein [Luteimonas weifangensis]RFP59412.1 MerC domain-containing protein [Luteimonas weifangensis]